MSRRRVSSHRKSKIVISDRRDLVLIDAEPIKRAEQKKCQSIMHQMDLARERLRRFAEESEPAFQQWLHSTFGKEITEIRELSQRHSELYRLIHEIEFFQETYDCSYKQAYEAVIKSREEPDPEPEPETETEHESKADPESTSHQSQPKTAEEMDAAFHEGFVDRFGKRSSWRGPKATYDELYEELLEDFRSAYGYSGGYSGGDRKNPEKQTPSSSDPAVDIESRLKTLYRSLARKLHPDVNADLDPKRKQLWHQVQDAYDAKDIERLESLSAMSELMGDHSKSVESIGSLKRLFEELKNGLRHLQREINRNSKDIAWSFEKKLEQPEKLERLRLKLARQMDDDYNELRDQIEAGEEQIERWKKKRSGQKKSLYDPYETSFE